MRATYKCRRWGDKTTNWHIIEINSPWVVEEMGPKAAAEMFAEEYGIEDMGRVEVFKHGVFKIAVVVDYEFYAELIQE